MKKTSSLRRQSVFGACVIFLALLAGCNKKESTGTPAPPSNEFLTTVELKLTNTADANDTQTAIWRQLDPTGSAAPDTSLAILNLKANATYSAQVILLDETQKPAVVVSDEIKQRQNYHLFFFQPTPISASNLVISNTSTDIPANDGTVTSATGPYLNLVVSRTDQDSNNPPLQIGLTDNFVTGAASTGWLRVVLRHQPNVKNGTYDPGSSDLDVNYKVNIQ
ncbi:MAG TPA: hypothetical protein VHE34_05640 [Puia sp.]|uniref:hypothetical protein n=1 Tax=Puia sp. TaxID=2045100 RepID=UPI002CB54ACA|nr:hypothetical protein [Puia sp.]HVU94683.1 hypothetical protein [Puia sp.]